MALSYVDANGGNLIIPGSYPSIKVAAANSGLSTTGVLVLIGEAESGPDFTSESDLSANAFGPDQVQEVNAKYKGGNIVEAFRQAAGAVIDPNLTGSWQRCIIVKTNAGTKASSVLDTFGGVYGTLYDLSWGSLGNRSYFSVTQDTREAVPTTGAFTYIPAVGTVALGVRISGNADLALATFAAADLPTTVQAAFDALPGIDASGGTARIACDGVTSVAVGVVSGNVVTFTKSVAGVMTWANVSVGDTLVVPRGGALAVAEATVGGAYVVLAINGAILTAEKKSDFDTGAPGVITAPVAHAAVASVGPSDLECYAPITVKLSYAVPTMGVGKTLEISELTTGTDLASRCFFNLGTARVTWLSTTSSPYVITSAAEYKVSLNVSRQVDSITENILAGGEVGLKLGYKGTDATVKISSTGYMTLVATGGSNAGTTSLKLSDFPTIADLAAYINSLTGWVAAPGTSVVGFLPSSSLDQNSWGSFDFVYHAGTEKGGYACRIKTDAYRFFNAITQNSALIQLNDPSVRAGGGLPQPTTTGGSPDVTDPNASVYVTFLSGGAKGGTLGADIVAAVDACEKLRANFIVPLFSRDAGDAVEGDIADGLTDTTSTYQIDAINAAVKSHVHKMSTTKARRNRQAFLSKRDTFANCANASANTASFRCSMTFQDFKGVASNGTITQYQPWMTALHAAATQAAAFYQSLVFKLVNATGVLQAAGDWTHNYDSDLENALLAGLLPVSKFETGGFYWVSDQTTYGKDNNSVYNSIQMVYAADTVALTTAQRMERAFVGKSLADVTAAIALSYLDGIMADFYRLKLIASSDDAPLGYRNAVIKIVGPVMKVSVEVKIAGSIYFIPITFYVTEITQTASQNA